MSIQCWACKAQSSTARQDKCGVLTISLLGPAIAFTNCAAFNWIFHVVKYRVVDQKVRSALFHSNIKTYPSPSTKQARLMGLPVWGYHWIRKGKTTTLTTGGIGSILGGWATFLSYGGLAAHVDQLGRPLSLKLKCDFTLHKTMQDLKINCKK